MKLLLVCILMLAVVPLASAEFENYTRFDVYVLGAPDIFYNISNASVFLSFEYVGDVPSPSTIRSGKTGVGSYLDGNGWILSSVLRTSDVYGRSLEVYDSYGVVIPENDLLVIRNTDGNTTQSPESYFGPVLYRPALIYTWNSTYLPSTAEFATSEFYGLETYARQSVSCVGDTLYVYYDALPRYYMSNWKSYIFCEQEGCTPGWTAEYPAGVYEFELLDSVGVVPPVVYLCYDSEYVNGNYTYAWAGYGFWNGEVGEDGGTLASSVSSSSEQRYSSSDLVAIATDAAGTTLASFVWLIDLIIVAVVIMVALLVTFYIVSRVKRIG